MLYSRMRSKKTIESNTMQEREYLESTFDTYVAMVKNATDWTLFCPYQLQKKSFAGVNKVLELPSMQITHTYMDGGIMYDYVPPKNAVVFSVMQQISNKACLDQMKLQTDMISVVDDKKIYNFMHNGCINIIDVSLKENANTLLLKKLKEAVDHYYIDEEQRMGHLLQNIIDVFADRKIIEEHISIKIEKLVTEAMLHLIAEQEISTPRFTKSEKIVLNIKKQLFTHMDGKISISSLAKKYNISEKSLQNAFRSLYDITPVQFIRLLKLNHVHHELVQNRSVSTSVSRVAQKWGFSHMGKFSKHYTELFGENPSVTLKKINPEIKEMSEKCVQRQEEMM